jgi:hypothetical protein
MADVHEDWANSPESGLGAVARVVETTIASTAGQRASLAPSRDDPGSRAKPYAAF